MRKVILADDEVHIRHLVRCLIHWEELGLELVGDYDNGRDVLAQMERDAADIIVTDVKMPEMDGLEMIRAVRAKWPDCRFVIISGFRDFEYAQAALKLGVADYILKPIDEKELNATLAEVKARQENAADGRPAAAAAARQDFVQVLRGQCPAAGTEEVNRKYGFHFAGQGDFLVLWLALCGAAGRDAAEPAHRVLRILTEGLAEFCTEQEPYALTAQSYVLLVQVRPGENAAFLRCIDSIYRRIVRTEQERSGIRFYLAAGKSVPALCGITQSVDSARFFSSGRLLYGTSRVYIADAMPQAEDWQQESRPLPAEISRELERCIEACDADAAAACLHRAFAGYRENQVDNAALYFYLCRQLAELLVRVLGRLGVSAGETFRLRGAMELATDDCDSIAMLERTAAEQYAAAMRRFLADKRDNTLSYVQFAKEYIGKHYAEDVSLNVIAEKAHVNPAYLSSVFKKAAGVNYSDYLIAVRIEKAKELLQRLDLNITQVAASVGYSSTRYFSRIFENATGIRPSEYRRLYLHEWEK